MSGGSLDYMYLKVEDVAGQIKERAENGLQQAFAEYLFDVAKALHDLEWHYSRDTINPEPDSVKKLISNDQVLQVLNIDADKLIEQIKKYRKV